MAFYSPGELIFPENMSMRDQDDFKLAMHWDFKPFRQALVEYSRHKNIDTSIDRFESSPGDKETEYFSVNLDKLCSILSPEELHDLMELYWKKKRELVERMIDVFVNPEREEYKLEEGNGGVSLLEKFLASKHRN